MGGNKLKLWCTNFIQFKRIAYKNEWDEVVPDNVAIISINNSESVGSIEEYHICKDADNVLNLNFDDVDPEPLGLSEDIENYTYKYQDGTEVILQLFTNTMAEKAVDFIEKNKNKNFYIHCSAGVSRSQAFVRYIQNVYCDKDWETNPNNPCEFPNGFVYSKLMQTYRNEEIYFNFINDLASGNDVLTENVLH